MRRDLISNALKKRFRKLCGRISTFAPERFGEMSPFVSQILEQLQNSTPDYFKEYLSAVSVPDGWMEAGDDCLSSLRRLSLGKPLQLRPAQPQPLAPFIKKLSAAARDPEHCFQLLTQRYSCPLNFVLPAEDESREHVLTRLMVQDRARIEKNSLEAINGDDLLLRLNLTALHASLVPDLRFLDALNYYYELMPANWQPRAQHDWLLASYFAFYARALTAWVSER